MNKSPSSLLNVSNRHQGRRCIWASIRRLWSFITKRRPTLRMFFPSQIILAYSPRKWVALANKLAIRLKPSVTSHVSVLPWILQRDSDIDMLILHWRCHLYFGLRFRPHQRIQFVETNFINLFNHSMNGLHYYGTETTTGIPQGLAFRIHGRRWSKPGHVYVHYPDAPYIQASHTILSIHGMKVARPVSLF